ncbi:aa3-type cytochrome c oxidase subunit IV [Alloyangia pacifica]|uniref:Aa3 type cytochrome c oxidase subunit IV n=1 Tax=Alloyangia pacifica TaxID=311180 RepID=A0A1I6WIB1_9RHOB|nr:aa3-type cytochrome c oxidase subunit IV [Alloyangia pacifica]SDI79101.1 aa3 type cytochrome c oxidase subunit IV [Alloyangia pacifica]SFT25730.1 aa3 type cytochrome c oxidase subunit IV [Alloyangia pacifica]
MADYKPGSMDITAQEQTFHGFIKWVIRTVYVIIAVLLFLAIFNS